MFDLRITREQEGITQTELANKVGVTRQAISLFELKVNKPSVAIAKKIGEVLHFDWTQFYEDNCQN